MLQPFLGVGVFGQACVLRVPDARMLVRRRWGPRDLVGLRILHRVLQQDCADPCLLSPGAPGPAAPGRFAPLGTGALVGETMYGLEATIGEEA